MKQSVEWHGMRILNVAHLVLNKDHGDRNLLLQDPDVLKKKILHQYYTPALQQHRFNFLAFQILKYQLSQFFRTNKFSTKQIVIIVFLFENKHVSPHIGSIYPKDPDP